MVEAVGDNLVEDMVEVVVDNLAEDMVEAVGDNLVEKKKMNNQLSMGRDIQQ